MPRMGSRHRYVLRHAELQLSLAVNHEGIGKIGSIGGLIKIVAVVAQQRTDTLTLCIEL